MTAAREASQRQQEALYPPSPLGIALAGCGSPMRLAEARRAVLLHPAFTGNRVAAARACPSMVAAVDMWEAVPIAMVQRVAGELRADAQVEDAALIDGSARYVGRIEPLPPPDCDP